MYFYERTEPVQSSIPGRTFVVLLYLNHPDKKGFSIIHVRKKKSERAHKLMSIREALELGCLYERMAWRACWIRLGYYFWLWHPTR